MIRPFLLISTLLLLMVMGITWHYLNSKPTSSLEQIVTLTNYATPSLSVGFDKPQTLQGSTHNSIYPEMSSTSPMEFVYVQ